MKEKNRRNNDEGYLCTCRLKRNVQKILEDEKKLKRKRKRCQLCPAVKTRATGAR